MRFVFPSVTLALVLALAGCGGGGIDAEKATDEAVVHFDGSVSMVMPDRSTITIKVKIWDPARECVRTVLVDEAIAEPVTYGNEDRPTNVVFYVNGEALDCRS